MLKEYTRRPNSVLACKIEEDCTEQEKGCYSYQHKRGSIITLLEFESKKKPAVGDFIVQDGASYILIKETEFNKKYVSTGFVLR